MTAARDRFNGWSYRMGHDLSFCCRSRIGGSADSTGPGRGVFARVNLLMALAIQFETGGSRGAAARLCEIARRGEVSRAAFRRF
jgi:hypothetical protein